MRPDFVFFARRLRLWGVRICGYVTRPAYDAIPRIERIPERNREAIRYWLKFKPAGEPDAKRGQIYFGHYDPYVPDHITTLVIILPDGTEHRIERRKR